MPQFDPSTFASQIFWLVVAFFLVFLVAWRVALPRLGEVLDNRRTRVDTDIARARELTEEAEQVLAAYEAELTSARDKAKEALNEAATKAAKASDAAKASIGEVATDIAVAATDRLIGVRPANDAAGEAVASVMKERG